MRFALALLLIPLAFAAENLKLAEPFQSIVDLASSAPPELAADALLRIVESGKLKDENARRQLVEQAFQLAASAKLPVRMVGVPGTTTDTASGSLNQAYGLKLDALSLQSRAVRDMVPLDPAKARELFGQIVKPVLAPLTCDDALTYDLSEYYPALVAVVNNSFNAKEKAEEKHVNLLLDAIAQVVSTSQLAPLSQAIQSANVTEAQRVNLSTRLASVVENIKRDERTCPKDSPKLDKYWQSANGKQLLEAGKKLRYGLTDANHPTSEWQQQLADYLNLIADWTADQEPSNTDYYHERCIVYTALLDLVPPGPQYDTILAEYVDFISNSGVYGDSPVEWYVEPYTVLNRSLNSPAAHAKVLAAYRESGNPVLTLEVALEEKLR